MMKKRKIIICLAVVFLSATALYLLICLCIGKFFPEGILYKGFHNNHISGVLSAVPGADIENDDLKIIETDNYGRVLFTCRFPLGLTNGTDSKRVAVVAGITQMTTEMENASNNTGYVYIYEGKNVSVKYFQSFNNIPFENIYENFTEDEILRLKQSNDWNDSLNYSKMSGVEVQRRKERTVSKFNRWLVYRELSDELNFKNSWFSINYDNDCPLDTDEKGRSIYYFRAGRKGDVGYVYEQEYIVFFDEQGRTDFDTGVIQLKDGGDYTHILSCITKLKEQNSWDSIKVKS